MATPSSSVVSPPPVVNGPPAAYEDVDLLRSADGIIAIISRRRANGVFTFGIFKSFERDGKFERSAFVPENMIDSYLDMATLVRTRIAELMMERDNSAKAFALAKTGQARSGRK